MEIIVLDWLKEMCGLPAGAGGVLVSGGSFAIVQFLECAGYISHEPRQSAHNIIIPFVIMGGEHANGEAETAGSERVEQVETRQRTQGMESIHKTHTAHGMEGQRRQAAKGGRIAGRREVHTREE